MCQFKDQKGPLLWTIQGGGYVDPTRKAVLGVGDFADLLEADLEELKPRGASLDFEIGTYGLSELIVLRPSRSRDVEPGRRRLDVLVAISAQHYARVIHVDTKPPTEDDIRNASPIVTRAINEGQLPGFEIGFLRSTPTIPISNEYWLRIDNAFEAKLGQNNEWTIPLPDELMQAVRDALKVEAAPKATPKEKSAAVKGDG